MNKITYYTAYLPEPRVVVDRARRSESAIANNQLGDCARRLDKQTQKLENLDQSCLTNIAKCNRYYNNAQKNETRINNSIRESKKILKSYTSSLMQTKAAGSSSRSKSVTFGTRSSVPRTSTSTYVPLSSSSSSTYKPTSYSKYKY